MRINLREFLKDRSKESKDLKKRKKIIKDILLDLKKEKINFCILRNYESPEKESDVDLLFENDKKINKILNKYGLKKRYSYAKFMSYKGNGLWFDIKYGALLYHGIKYKSAKKVLETKRKYKYFFILSETEEFIHLILHCILHKGEFKEKYAKKIKKLYKKLDKNVLKKEFEKLFSGYGKKVLEDVEKENYDDLLILKKKLLSKMFKVEDIPSCIMVRIVFFYGKYVRKFIKKSY